MSLTEQDYKVFINKFKPKSKQEKQEKLDKTKILNRIIPMKSSIEEKNESISKKSIIKKVKSMKKERKEHEFKIEMEKNIELNKYDDYLLNDKAAYIHVSPIKTSREGLNEYLYKRFIKSKTERKWWENYKGVSNENSMLEEERIVDMFIPSESSLKNRKEEGVLYEKALIVKNVLEEMKSRYDDDDDDDDEKDWFIENIYKSLLVDYEKKREEL